MLVSFYPFDEGFRGQFIKEAPVKPGAQRQQEAGTLQERDITSRANSTVVVRRARLGGTPIVVQKVHGGASDV